MIEDPPTVLCHKDKEIQKRVVALWAAVLRYSRSGTYESADSLGKSIIRFVDIIVAKEREQ